MTRIEELDALAEKATRGEQHGSAWGFSDEQRAFREALVNAWSTWLREAALRGTTTTGQSGSPDISARTDEGSVPVSDDSSITALATRLQKLADRLTATTEFHPDAHTVLEAGIVLMRAQESLRSTPSSDCADAARQIRAGKIEALRHLPKNWNSYGCDAMSQRVIDEALKLNAYIPVEFDPIIPIADGGLMFGKDGDDVTVEVHAHAAALDSAMRVEGQQNPAGESTSARTAESEMGNAPLTPAGPDVREALTRDQIEALRCLLVRAHPVFGTELNVLCDCALSALLPARTLSR